MARRACTDKFGEAPWGGLSDTSARASATRARSSSVKRLPSNSKAPTIPDSVQGRSPSLTGVITQYALNRWDPQTGTHILVDYFPSRDAALAYADRHAPGHWGLEDRSGWSGCGRGEYFGTEPD